MGLFSGDGFEGLYDYLGNPVATNLLLPQLASDLFFATRWLEPREQLFAGFQQVWTGAPLLSAGFQQPISVVFESGLRQPFGPAPVLQSGFAQWWRGATQLSAGFKQPWAAPVPLSAGFQQPFLVPAPLSAGFQQPFAVAGQSLYSGLQQVFSVSSRVELWSGFVQPWSDVGEGETVTYAVDVTAGGVPLLSAGRIAISGGRDGYALKCPITLYDQAEYARCRRVPVNLAGLSAADRAEALAAASLVVTDNYDTYQFYIFSGGRSRQPGESTYTIVAESPARLLDAPYALPITAEYGREMTSAVAVAIAAGGGIELDWQLVDEYLPSNLLYANLETPLAVLRKLTEAQGGILQSSPSGQLSAVSRCPVSPPDWPTAEVTAYFSDLDHFFGADESDDIRDGYNSFLISDHTSASDSVRFEEKAISATVVEVRAYVIPWSDDPLPLETSGPGRVAIAAPQIVEELIEDEQVEFIAGSGKTTKPIYSIADRDYGDNRQLGYIDWSEDGMLTAEVSGQSLCLVDYRTKYWMWRTTDAVAESVQFWTKPIWADMPVTIIVRYGDAAATSALVVVEPDDTLNVDAEGNVKSEFAPGEKFYFQLQHDSTVRVASVTSSAGTLAGRGQVTRAKKQQQVFADTGAIELPTIPAGGVAAAWYGRSPALAVDGRKISVGEFPAIAELTWQTLMQSYCLTPPPLDLAGEEKYYIVVLVEVESV